MKKARSFVVSLAAVVLAATASVACGGPLTYQVQGSQVATGADAKVVADVDEAKCRFAGSWGHFEQFFAGSWGHPFRSMKGPPAREA